MAKKKDETVLSSKSGDKTDKTVFESEKIIKKARSRSGQSAGEVSSGTDTQDQTTLEIQRQLDQLYSPENFKGLVRAPADIAMAVTGSKHFNLSDKEVETLATTGSATMRFWTTANPKYLSLILFSFSVITIYGTRTVMYFQEKRMQRKQEKKEDGS